MPRRLRFVPAHQLVAVTCRTVRGEYRLRPDSKVNAIVAGALGRALERHGIKLHAVAVMSNHLHLLLTPETAKDLAGFMHEVNRKIAFELNRRHRCTGPFWAGRYHSVLVSDEEAAQVAQLKYHLGQGCKEGLVASPLDWPGIQSARALMNGESIEGTWFHRTEYRRARLRDEEVTEAEHTTRHFVEFEPLPAWAHLSPDAYRQRVGDLVREIEGATAEKSSAEGNGPLGARGVLARHPFDRPRELEQSPQPLALAVSKSRRKLLEAAYREFYTAFHEAAQQLRSGDLEVDFPPGSFPPALPYVEDQVARDC